MGTPATTLNVYGSNFLVGATVQWNGTALSTTWLSSKQLTALIPAANLASISTANVTVVNPNSSGTSSPRTFAISATPSPAAWVRKVAGIGTPQHIAWDPVHGRLYVTIASNDPVAPNTVIPVDPIAGTAGTPVAAGNNPNLLSLSSDSSYLWVSLDGDSAVQRFQLPSLTKDISFPVPIAENGYAQRVMSLEAAPTSPHTVAIAVSASESGNGVYIYDDSTQRPVSVPGWEPGGGPDLSWLQWADDSTIYGTVSTEGTAEKSVTGGMWTLKVTPQGVAQADKKQYVNLGPGDFHYDSISGLLYVKNLAFDPVRNLQAGTFGGPGFEVDGWEADAMPCTVNPPIGRFYCLGQGLGSLHDTLWIFDQKTFNLIHAVDLGQTIPVDTHIRSLTPWGSDGLAALVATSNPGNGTLYLIDGEAINPNSAPDTTSGTALATYPSLSSVKPNAAPVGTGDMTLTITGQGFTQSSVAYSDYRFDAALMLQTEFVSPTQITATLPASVMATSGPHVIAVYDDFAGQPALNSLAFTVYPAPGPLQITAVNLSGLNMVWDPFSALLYVSTSQEDSLYPNAIVAVNPSSGAIVKTQPVSTNPSKLALSSDGSHLFTSFARATTMTELALPGLDSPVTWALNNPANHGPFFACDLVAAPQSPNTTAVSLCDFWFEPPSVGGVVIYDNNVQRPTIVPGWAQGQVWPNQQYDLLAWSSSVNTLAATSTHDDGSGGYLPVYGLNVDQSGVSYRTTYDDKFNLAATMIHSDFGTGMIYSDDGVVANPFDGSIVGEYNASGLVAPDSSTNRVYILGQTFSQRGSNNYTIESFNQTTFAPVSSVVITTGIFAIPEKMIRWGTSGLAVLTRSFGPYVSNSFGPEGILYIYTDPAFVSGNQPATSLSEPKPELVQKRWKNISSRDRIQGSQPRPSGIAP